MASTIGKFGGNVVGPLLKFFAIDWLAMIIIQVVVFSFILLFLAKVNPIKFWKSAIEPWIITFTTGSSNAALPVNMKLAPKMGVPKEISSFVLPIGATANMNGICAFLGLLSVFALQVYGIEQTVPLLLYIVFQCVVLAIGTAAVPQGGVIMATVLFTSLGFPLEIVGIVAGAYKIVDGIHTTSNSVGDLVISLAVASNENVLDKEKYDSIIV
jgi:Na+/H+-dicarboxylate symporter